MQEIEQFSEIAGDVMDDISEISEDIDLAWRMIQSLGPEEDPDMVFEDVNIM